MSTTILITGASGRLGNKVVTNLLALGAEPHSIAVLVRTEEKGRKFESQGLQVRIGSYNDTEALKKAVIGIKRALLISTSEVGTKQTMQHKNFILAAQQEGIALLAYTSLLHADISSIILAESHKDTEELIKKSGLSYSFLRNRWYLENSIEHIDTWQETGSIVGATGEGRISAASINDYAEAAAKVLLSKSPNKSYELGGWPGYTLDELASCASEVLGKHVKAEHLTKAKYAKVLTAGGMPASFADLMADAEDQASRGALYDTSGELQSLLGRPTESIKQVIRESL